MLKEIIDHNAARIIQVVLGTLAVERTKTPSACIVPEKKKTPSTMLSLDIKVNVEENPRSLLDQRKSQRISAVIITAFVIRLGWALRRQ